MDRRADTLSSIVVEFAKETRPRRDPYEADRLVRARRPPGFRLIVSGISRDTSWQVRVFLLLVGFFCRSTPPRSDPVDGLLPCINVVSAWHPDLTTVSRSGLEGLWTRGW